MSACRITLHNFVPGEDYRIGDGPQNITPAMAGLGMCQLIVVVDSKLHPRRSWGRGAGGGRRRVRIASSGR